MTTPYEEKLIREGEEREARRQRDYRERNNLTVRKAIITKSVCNRCNHSWPYIEGDEDKPCPACHGGTGRFWQTKPLTPLGHSTSF